MKTNFLNIAAVLVSMTMATAGFTSCSSDDENDINGISVVDNTPAEIQVNREGGLIDLPISVGRYSRQ